MAPLAGLPDSSSTSITGLTRAETSGASSGGQQVSTSTTGDSDLMPTVKCVLVGDGAVGKTSLLVSYASSECPSNYVPTAYDNYAGENSSLCSNYLQCQDFHSFIYGIITNGTKPRQIRCNAT